MLVIDFKVIIQQ